MSGTDRLRFQRVGRCREDKNAICGKITRYKLYRKTPQKISEFGELQFKHFLHAFLGISVTDISDVSNECEFQTVPGGSIPYIHEIGHKT